MGYPPVVVVESGGVPRTQVAEGGSAPAATVSDVGRPITLTDNAPPIMLYDGNGDPWTPYSDEAVALFARFTTQPTTARKVLIDNLIVSLKTVGVWTKLDALYVMAAADSQAARRNWVQDLYNLTAVSSPTFSADRGYAGNGTSSYLTTGYTPGSGLYALNSAHIGIWSRTNNASASAVTIGARTASTPTGQGLLLVRSASDTISYRLNQDVAGGSHTITDSSGHIVGVRTGAAAKEAFRNGASLGTTTDASTTLPNVAFFLDALNNAGAAANFDTRQLAVGHIGAALSAAEVSASHAAFNTYLQAVGAG